MATAALRCCVGGAGVLAGGGDACPGAPSPPAIEIEFETGARMRLMGPVDASTVKVMVAVLAKARRR
jgi:transposase